VLPSFPCASEQEGGTGQRRNHARVRSAAPDAGVEYAAGREVGRVGEEVRRAVQGRLRRHPPTHDAAAAEEAKNRIFGGRKGRRLRTALVAAHFDVSRILETWKLPSVLVFGM